MFDFLKKLVTRPVPITITAFTEPEVTFTSSKDISMGLHDVIAEVAGEKIRLRIDVKEQGETEFRGNLVEPQEAVPFLKEIYAPWDEKRESTRLHRNLRVISRDLPGFKGTSRDLSMTGIRIEVEAPVPIGSIIELRVDLDDARATTLTLRGETRWCAPKVNTPYSFVGVHFTDVSQGDKAALRRFLDTLQRSEEEGALS